MPETKPTQISFHISGMHCASCAANIQRRLKKEKGIVTAQVNYGSEQATIKFEPQTIPPQKIDTVISHLGYHAHMDWDPASDLADQEKQIELAKLKKELITGAVLTVILLVAAMWPTAPAWLAQPLTMFILATPVQFWVGKRYYQSAWSALKNLTANMDTLVVLGTSVAYGYSLIVWLMAPILSAWGLNATVYFETSAAIITLVTLGKYLEMKAKNKTNQAIKQLVNLTPQTANKKIGSEYQVVAVKEVMPGDELLIKPGEKVPVDGKVIQNESEVDESMITGESLPVLKAKGDQVIGGTININGSLIIEATKVGKDAFLAQVVALTQAAASSRPPIQNLVDKVAAIFVPVVIGLAAITFLAWMGWGPKPALPYALNNMVAVLIIACPCALGLATPTALISGIGRGAKMGILIKDAESLEIAKSLKAIIFDKTGTLTLGKPEVRQMKIVSGLSQTQQDDITSKFKQMTMQSLHPLSMAISNYISVNKLASGTIKITDYPGKGILAENKGQTFRLGSKAYLANAKVKFIKELEEITDKWEEEAMTVVWGAIEDQAVIAFGIMDTVRPEAGKVINRLMAMGITPVMMTGDSQKTAARVAKMIQIKQFKAQVLPDQKEAQVRQLRQDIGRVGMVGDGINDAPALAAADTSIAMGGGTQIAMQAAAITLLHDNLSLIPQAIKLSRVTMTNIKENLGWAFGYNIILIPVAMGVLYPKWGITLNPMLAAAAMAFSSVSVVLNALRLQKIRLG